MNDRAKAQRAVRQLEHDLDELRAVAQRQSPSTRQAMMTNINFVASNLSGLSRIIDVELDVARPI